MIPCRWEMRPPLKVLIVDDDPTVLAVTRALLEDLGYEVTVRNEALGTTAVILREQPDVVLLDIEMPALSGDKLMHLVANRRELRGVSFILHSGARAQDLQRLTEETGALGAIAKTGDHLAFTSEFQRLVRSRDV